MAKTAKKSYDFNTDKLASYKQLQAVGRLWSLTVGEKEGSAEFWKAGREWGACLKRIGDISPDSEDKGQPWTSARVQQLRLMTKIPSWALEAQGEYLAKNPKGSKKPKASPKSKTSPKASKKPSKSALSKMTKAQLIEMLSQ